MSNPGQLTDGDGPDRGTACGFSDPDARPEDEGLPPAMPGALARALRPGYRGPGRGPCSGALEHEAEGQPQRVEFVILLEPASKANSRKIVIIGGRPKVIKSQKARDYERDAVLQIPASAKVMFACPVRVTMTIFYASERPDLDESVVLDVLQAKTKGSGKDRKVLRRGVYFNDRQVREKHVFHAIDRLRPRAEIVVEPLIEQGSLI